MKGRAWPSTQLNTPPGDATKPEIKVPAMKKSGPAASAGTTIPASSRGPSTGPCRLLGSGAPAILAFHNFRDRFAFFLALLDPRGGDDVLVVGDIEQADTRAVAADDT